MPSVAKNTAYLTIALVGQKILSFVYFTLLARFLGAESIGQYTFALAFTTIFSTIIDLGVTPVLIREVARAENKTDGYVKTIMALKLILTVVVYSVVIGAAYLLKYSGLVIQFISLSGLVMVLDTFSLTFYGALRGRRTLKFEAIGMVSGQMLTLFFGGVALLLHWSLHFYFLALAAGSAFNLFFSFYNSRRFGILFKPAIDFELLRKLFHLCAPFALAGVFTKIYSYIDAVFIQYIKGNIEVGWYSIPYKLTFSFQFLPMALSAAIFPAFAAAWRQDKNQLHWIFDRALLYSIFISLPLVFSIAVLAPQIILSLYGHAFQNSILPLEISIFSLIFIFLYYPVGSFLNATNHQTANTTFMGITMVVNVVLNLILIPAYGIIGAAITSVATNALLFFLAFSWSLKFIRPSLVVFKALLKAGLAVCVMLLVGQMIKNSIPWFITGPIIISIYAFLLLILRAIKWQDVIALKKIFKSEEQEISNHAGQ